MSNGDAEGENNDRLIEALRQQYERVSFDLKNIMRVDGVLDSSLEQMVNRENITDILNDVAGIFMNTADFIHSEINVFAYPVRNFVGMSYSEFSKKNLSEIIDNSVSKFSKEQLAVLDNDIKQTSYLLINGEEGKVYVSDANDIPQLKKVFAPVYAGCSTEIFDNELSEKVRKTTDFGIKSHLSVLLHSYKVDESGKRKIPIGYFHLTKKNEFSEYDFYLVDRIVNHSAVVIDNYFNLKKKEELLKQVNDMNKNDVERASRIVSALVPSKLPSVKGFDFASYYMPSAASDDGFSGVGGDCFDILKLDDSHLGFMMFDISGHGIPSAMIASNAKSSFVNYFDAKTPLPEVFKKFVGHMGKVYPGYEGDEYLTALLAVIDTKTLELSYCRAAHPYPLVYRSGERKTEKLVSKGGMIFLNDNISSEWCESRTKLNKGDYLVLFTDGLTDVVKKDGDVSIKKELYEINGVDFGSSKELLDHIFKMRKGLMREFFNDDIACLVVGVKK